MYINYTEGLDLKADSIQIDASHLRKHTRLRTPNHTQMPFILSVVPQSHLQVHKCHSTMYQLKKNICPKKVFEDMWEWNVPAFRRGLSGTPSPAGPQEPLSRSHPQKDRMVLLMISTASWISSSLITSGGANLMMSPWVGLARSPLSRSRRHTFQAS